MIVKDTMKYAMKYDCIQKNTVIFQNLNLYTIFRKFIQSKVAFYITDC